MIWEKLASRSKDEAALGRGRMYPIFGMCSMPDTKPGATIGAVGTVAITVAMPSRRPSMPLGAQALERRPRGTAAA
jgi:hypothetical protein